MRERLEQAVARTVQFVTFEEANPLLLVEVLRDGRVLADRDGDWAALVERSPQLAKEAAVARRLLDREVFEGLSALLAEAGE